MKVIKDHVLDFEEDRIIPKDQPNLAVEMRLNENIQDSSSLRNNCKVGSQLTRVSVVTDCLLLSAAPAVSPETLRNLRVTCVVNAAAELPDTPLPCDYSVQYVKVAVNDRTTADLFAHLDSVADIIDKVRCQGGRTLVHCVAGVSRSASLCLAYLVKHEKMSLKKAFCHLRSCRSSVRPNCGFFSQLIEFERKVTGSATVSMVHNQAVGSLIPDVYEPEYQNMLWYQQHYNRNFGRH